jgi:thiol-disulfide isomerase/thioredoxin
LLTNALVLTVRSGRSTGTLSVDASGEPVAGSFDVEGRIGGVHRCIVVAALNDDEGLSMGSAPFSLNSWPYDSGYRPNRRSEATDAGVSEDGFMELGDVPNDVELVDQYGRTVELYQFYGSPVLVEVSAVWCPSCQQAAESSNDLWQDYRGDGVVFLTLMLEDANGAEADADDATMWADFYGLEDPVLASQGGSGLADFRSRISGLPTIIMLDRELTVVEASEGYPGDAVLSNGIEDAL